MQEIDGVHEGYADIGAKRGGAPVPTELCPRLRRDLKFAAPHIIDKTLVVCAAARSMNLQLTIYTTPRPGKKLRLNERYAIVIQGKRPRLSAQAYWLSKHSWSSGLRSENSLQSQALSEVSAWLNSQVKCR
jgi:hypothetical protein